MDNTAGAATNEAIHWIFEGDGSVSGPRRRLAEARLDGVDSLTSRLYILAGKATQIGLRLSGYQICRFRRKSIPVCKSTCSRTRSISFKH